VETGEGDYGRGRERGHEEHVTNHRACKMIETTSVAAFRNGKPDFWRPEFQGRHNLHIFLCEMSGEEEGCNSKNEVSVQFQGVGAGGNGGPSAEKNAGRLYHSDA